MSERFQAYKIWGEQEKIIAAKDEEIKDLRRRLQLCAIYDGDKDIAIDKLSTDYYQLSQRVQEYRKWLNVVQKSEFEGLRRSRFLEVFTEMIDSKPTNNPKEIQNATPCQRSSATEPLVISSASTVKRTPLSEEKKL